MFSYPIPVENNQNNEVLAITSDRGELQTVMATK
jgi:hypothetical protein